MCLCATALIQRNQSSLRKLFFGALRVETADDSLIEQFKKWGIPSPQRVGPPEAVSGSPRRVSQRWHRLSPSSRPQSHLCVTPPPASPSPANQSPSPPDPASRAVSASKLHFYLRRRPVPGSFQGLRPPVTLNCHSASRSQ